MNAGHPGRLLTARRHALLTSVLGLVVAITSGGVVSAEVDPLAPVGPANGAAGRDAAAAGAAAPSGEAAPGGEAATAIRGAAAEAVVMPANLGALPPEVRAIWVVRDALADPEPERIVTYARELGANTLFVQVSGRGDAWYDSEILPRAETLPADRGDPFARLMAEARAQGVSVHAWVNVGLVWSGRTLPEDPRHVLRAHPEWIACLPDGAPLAAVPQDSLLAWYVEGVFAELWHAGYRRHVASVAREILERYDVDGVHLDYIRRPVIETGYDVETVGRFLERSGRVAWEIAATGVPPDAETHRVVFASAGPVQDLRHRPSGRAWYSPRSGAAHPARAFRWPDYSDAVAAPATREWNRYRREAVTLAVAAVRTVVDEAMARDGRERVLTAAVMPDPARAQKRYAQDWPLWVDSGLLDYVVPMCYAAGREAAAEQIAKTLAAVSPDRVIAGVGAYQQPLGACALTLRDMLESDVRGVCIFSWGSLDEKRTAERAPALVRRAWMPVAEPEPRAGVPAERPLELLSVGAALEGGARQRALRPDSSAIPAIPLVLGHGETD